MKTIHGKNWDSPTPVWSDDRIADEIDYLAEEIVDDVEEFDELPEYFNPSKEVRGSFCSSGFVAQRMCEDWTIRLGLKRCTWWRDYIDAETLYDWFIENLYDLCDGCSILEPRGLDDLQKALDRFESHNLFLWRWVWKAKRFDPRKHSLGLKELQKALDCATEANRHHVLYEPMTNVQIALDREFWEGFWS